MSLKPAWLLWILLSISLASYFGYTLLASDDKSALLIGESSYGHYQIELACSSCHSDPFGGKAVLQDACVNCHGDDLKQAHDSHPQKKFTDPRDANRLEQIDARYCISCHTEHQQEQTHAMGVTLPDDYCFHCHSDIAAERSSHQGLAFDSCASAGCHNFHDNRALYESFLVTHANQAWLDDDARIPAANYALNHADRGSELAADSHAALIPPSTELQIADSWLHTSHAKAALTCRECHSNSATNQWLEQPGLAQCQRCHQPESNGFVAGKHGMRLSPQVDASLLAISPAESPLTFKKRHQNARHGCASCHRVHDSNPQQAAVDACLGCHDDQHSRAFLSSPHAKLWNQALNGAINHEQAVSCASCHLPRIADNNTGIKIVSKNTEHSQHPNGANHTVIRVEHNQNMYLRPNEKMIRPVCMQCHSLEFSIDALADQQLIDNNFSGKPSQHIPSIDWALKRDSSNRD